MIFVFFLAILLGSFILPWWWLCIVGLFFGYKFSRDRGNYKIFSSAFLSAFLIWGVFAYYFDSRSAGLVSQRMAGLFGFSEAYFMYFITGTIGGVAMLLSCWLGAEGKAYLRATEPRPRK